MKKFLSIVILIFVLTSLVSCNNEAPPEVDPAGTDAPETEPPVVYEYTPSLSAREDVKQIGIRVGDVIVEAACAGGEGKIFSMYEGAIIEGMAGDGGMLEPKRTPIVKYSSGMDIVLYNNMGYGEITDEIYFKFDPAQLDKSNPHYDTNAKTEKLPSEPGLYCCRITHTYSPEIDRSNIDPEIIDRMIGYMYFYVFIVVE